jgi:SAM-dependent methyltransferase
LLTTTGQWGNGGNEEPVRYQQQMDRSNGYEAVSEEFLARRGSGSTRSIAVGVKEVRKWARTLPRGSSVVDLGCGPGFPITVVLVEEGLHVFGVDVAPSFVAAFQRNCPAHPSFAKPFKNPDSLIEPSMLSWQLG